MDAVDSALLPKARQRRPKDSFQNELQAKLYQRRSQGLTAEVTDSDDDIQTSPYIKDYRSSYSNRPGSAKRRPDKSPDLGHGLGTTTMRSKDLTQLLHQSSGSLYDDDDDDDEELIAANMGRSNATGSWQPHGLKTPSPKQDPRYQRKTPMHESPKESSRLDSIYGRKTPTRESPKDQGKLDSLYGRKTPSRESPKDQGKLDSLYGRKTPTKDASPRSLTKEDIIFGRKTPSSVESHRLPGMDGTKDKPWQPPSFRSVSPNSPTEHSRGSRGVTPTDSMLEPIDEGLSDKVKPRLQRGEHLKGDVSSIQRSLGERPIPQSRSKTDDRKSPPLDRKSPLIERKSPYADRKSPYLDRKSPLLDSSISKESTPGMKRASPMYDLFGKSRSSAAQEVEDFIQSDKKTDPKYGRGLARSPEGRKTPSDVSKYQLQDKRKNVTVQERGKVAAKTTESKELNRKTLSGKKTPTDYKMDYGRKSPLDTKDNLKSRKSPQTAGSSLLDFLTEGQDKSKTQTKGDKGKKLDDELDDMFSSNQRYLSNKSPPNQYKSAYDKTDSKRKSPLDHHRPSLKKSTEDEMYRSQDYLAKKRPSYDHDDQDIYKQPHRSPDMIDSSHEKPRRIPKTRKEDESSVCEEIPLDPNIQRAKAEEKALKSGKETTQSAKTNNAIDTIAEAQTMQYIEPAKKVRPVRAEAKVQHRPKPRYGVLPGTKTETFERQFDSTSDIRDAIYEQWYAERLKSAKKKKKEEDKKKTEELEKKKKEEEERLQEAQLSYKAWVEKKKETVFREQAKKRHLEAEKKHQDQQEKEVKADEALKSFKHWKEKKDAMIRHELLKKREIEEDKQREKEEEDYKKRKDRETAFRGWSSKKERELEEERRRYKQEKQNVRKKKEDEKENERRKNEEANRKYLDWMEAKERQTKLEKKRSKIRLLSEEDDYKPAWSPASRTIPFGR